MNILEVDGVPVKNIDNERPASVGGKVRILQAAGEDLEWYPTTDEILAAMSEDLISFGKEYYKANGYGCRRDKHFHYNENERDYDSDEKKDCKKLSIESFLDVGAGDGRVFNAVKSGKTNFKVEIEKKYGIEKARAQGDDLIRNDVFLIGRDFFQITLVDKSYSVIFSNPPYSVFTEWTHKLLKEANFAVMYLVLPVRWENNDEIILELNRYEYNIIGEYDFTHADRAARARVNLIRVTKKKAENEDYSNDKAPDDAFTRWIEEHIGEFGNGKEKRGYEKEEEAVRAIKIKGDAIDDLLENYQYEMDNLIEALKFLPRLPARLFDAFDISKKSAVEVIRKEISALKNVHWRLTFNKLSAVNDRLTRETKNKLLSEMDEFKTLDFNGDNVYSIIIWVINNYNKYIPRQIVEVFNKLTQPDYIIAYKSNKHWDNDTWRYNSTGAKPDNEYVGEKGKGKPERYKLDYRIVARNCWYRYSGYDNSLIHDFIVVCRNLGYNIPEDTQIRHEANGREQTFLFKNGEERETAFQTRIFGNGNVHFKINKEIMLKFNIEVARILGWIRGPEDIQNEFEVGEAEAVNYWNKPALRMIGRSDLPLIEYKEAS